MLVSENAQYLSPRTSSPKWNAAIINVIISTCAFPALTSQNVGCGRFYCYPTWPETSCESIKFVDGKALTIMKW